MDETVGEEGVDVLDVEVKSLRSTFTRTRVIQNHDVTLTKMEQETDYKTGTKLISMRDTNIVHFANSCLTNVDQSMEFQLELCKGQFLGPADVAAWSLPKCRIVTMATNYQIRGASPGVAIGMATFFGGQYAGAPLGLLVSGASCVVSTYWKVCRGGRQRAPTACPRNTPRRRRIQISTA